MLFEQVNVMFNKCLYIICLMMKSASFNLPECFGSCLSCGRANGAYTITAVGQSYARKTNMLGRQD